MAPDNNIGPKGAKAVERQLARLETLAILYGTRCRHETSFCTIFVLNSQLNVHAEKALGKTCYGRLREMVIKRLTTLNLNGPHLSRQ